MPISKIHRSPQTARGAVKEAMSMSCRALSAPQRKLRWSPLNSSLQQGIRSQLAWQTAAFPCSPTSLPCSHSSYRKRAGQRERALKSAARFGREFTIREGKGRGNGWEPTRTRFAAQSVLGLCRSAGRAAAGLRDVVGNSFFIPPFTLNPLRAIGQHITI